MHAGADAAEVIFVSSVLLLICRCTLTFISTNSNPFLFFQNNQEYFPRDSSGNLAESSGDYVETWKEMEKCVELGLAKSIGISNFNSEQIERLLKHATIKPVTNQVEVHLYLNQKKLIEFCRRRDIVITSYGPLGGAIVEKEGVTPRMLEHPTLLKIAATHKKTPAQVALRYLVIKKAATQIRAKLHCLVFFL